jgi:tetratricopeptide (TPR) repeat protein
MGTRLQFPSASLPLLRALSLFLAATLPLASQTPAAEEIAERALRHQSPDWPLIEPHLPNPATATPAQLELAGDVLRARRFDDDAIDFYRSAIDRGGDVPHLMNLLGITELQLHRSQLARAYFQRALSLHRKDPQIWNNLGATEFLAGNVRGALNDYLKAVKLDKRNAVYHSNLGTAYFEAKDFESARKHFEMAFRLDPKIYERQDGAGVEARVFSPTDHGRFCFELARVAAGQHHDADVLLWLSKAADSGFDIQENMAQDRVFEPYRKDPRVAVILQNQRALRAQSAARSIAANTPVPTLPAAPTGLR